MLVAKECAPGPAALREQCKLWTVPKPVQQRALLPVPPGKVSGAASREIRGDKKLAEEQRHSAEYYHPR